MEERKCYIDYMKAIGIILVVIGHANFANSVLKEWIYSFHMPLFFFISGLNLKQYNEKTVFFIEKKIGTLLAPYFIWVLIFGQFDWGKLKYYLYGSYASIVQTGSAPSLWFLPTLFIAVTISYLLIKGVNNNRKLLVFFAIVLFALAENMPHLDLGYPFSLDVSMLSVLFIITGYCFKHIQTNTAFKYLCATVGLVGTQLYKINDVNGYSMMATNMLGNPLLFIITGVSGCIMIWGVCQILSEKKLKLLSYLGKNSLVIYVTNMQVLLLFEELYSNAMRPSIEKLFISTVGTLVICSACALLVNKYMPALAGKGKRKNLDNGGSFIVFSPYYPYQINIGKSSFS